MLDRKPIIPTSSERAPESRPIKKDRGYKPSNTISNPKPPSGGTGESE